MKHAFKNKKLGSILGFLFALFTVLASFGIGNYIFQCLILIIINM